MNGPGLEPIAVGLMPFLTELDEQQRTCVAEIHHPEEETPARLHIRKGQVVGVEPWTSDEEWTLGEYLARTEVADPGHLSRAQRRALKTDVGIEGVLLEMEVTSEDILRRFADLEQQERLFDILRRPNTTAEVVEQRPYSSPLAPPLSIPYILKEARRQLAAWSELRRSIGAPDAVYRREIEILSEVLGYEAPAPGEAPLPELSASARMTYFFMNGKRTITQIARTSGLAVFEVYLGLNELVKAQLVTLVTTHSKGELLKLRKPMLPLLVSGITSLILLTCGVLGAQWIVDNQEMLRSSLSATSPSVTATVERANIRHLHQSLRLYQLHHRAFPDQLDDLVKAGYVEAENGGSFARLRYEPNSVGYVLTSRRSPR